MEVVAQALYDDSPECYQKVNEAFVEIEQLAYSSLNYLQTTYKHRYLNINLMYLLFKKTKYPQILDHPEQK